MTTQIDGQAGSNTVRSTSSEPGLSEIMMFPISCGNKSADVLYYSLTLYVGLFTVE